MNTPETNSEISEQITALRRQVFTLLLVLIVVSGTLTVYLYRQAKMMRTDIAAIKPQATQIIQTFNQSKPNVENFVNQLVAYGSAHPDFQKEVLNKYGLIAPPPAAKK
jgi:DNA integrity scanning protein DisA with diadenylate cyclase activity